MLKLSVGTAGSPRTGLDVPRFGEAVRRLSEDATFGQLLVETADHLVHLWSLAATPVEREAYWHNIQGLQKLLGYMQSMVEQGNLAAHGEGAPAEKRPSTT